jgi:hypothetical protein
MVNSNPNTKTIDPLKHASWVIGKIDDLASRGRPAIVYLYLEVAMEGLGSGRADQMEISYTYDTVELAAFVSLRAAVVLGLASAELAEVFGGPGDYVFEQFHFDPPQLLP